MEKNETHVGKFICMRTDGTRATCTSCFEVTDELPSTRADKGPLWIIFGELAPGDLMVTPVFSETHSGFMRYLSELKTGVSRGRSPIFDEGARFQLGQFGLTPERYTELVLQAAAQL